MKEVSGQPKTVYEMVQVGHESTKINKASLKRAVQELKEANECLAWVVIPETMMRKLEI